MGIVNKIRQLMPASVGNLVRKIVPRSIKAAIGKRMTRGIAAKTPVVTVQDGRKFKTIEDGLFFRVFFEGIYEPELSTVFEQLVREDDTIVDVGGNFGWYATLFAKAAPRGKVISYEPVPDTFEVLRENIAMNNMAENVELHPVCVGEQAGTVSFLRTGNSGLGHVATGNETGESIDIAIVTLDEQLHGLAGKIALIKIHVEGFELNVLRGSRQLLAADHPPVVQVKLTDDRLERYGVSRHDICQFFRDCDMAVYELLPNGNLAETERPTQHEIFAVGSGVFADRFRNLPITLKSDTSISR
jgi:FkbM family methyltransferase